MTVPAAPRCKPQTLQTSVCSLTVAKRRARAPRMASSDGGTLLPGAADGVTKREGTIDPVGRTSRVSGHLHPSRDVTLPMQHTPDVDVVGMLNVEDQIGITLQQPGAQARQVQLVGISRRALGQMPADVAVCVLQGVNEAVRGSLGASGKKVGDRVLDIPLSQLARDDGLGLHDRLRALPATLAAPRTRSRMPSK